MQRDAFDVAEAWGFTIKSEIVWCKMTKNGLPHFGMGRTVRGSHETCLIAHRGRANDMIKSHRVRSTFSAPMPTDGNGRIVHSAKPDKFFDIVDELTGRVVPRIELFARQYRATWDVLGNQLPEAA
jgi:N6-adenosine-specific RNA methylase IME4